MSKKISVMIKDKYTIILGEDASKGDYIDLREISSLDTSYLEQLIEIGQDQIYNKKLAEMRTIFETEKKNAVAIVEANCRAEFTAEIAKMKMDHQQSTSQYKNQIQELEDSKKYELQQFQIDFMREKNEALQEKENQYLELQNQYRQLQTEFDVKLKQKELEIKEKTDEEKMTLKSQLMNLEKEYATKLEKEILKVKEEKQTEINDINSKHHQEILEKTELIYQLKNQKAALNIKQIGEDLESWCNNEVKEQMQNGFFNCTWKKDTMLVKEDGEKHGTKADYIFEIFATEEHKEDELLASICLDMKDENPDSINKQSNDHYYKTLDKNRIKKNCKYAVLVSNLESDRPNALPIFKVREYVDMYVVRPGYLMTFLHMITSLCVRFKELILKKEAEELELKNRRQFIGEFEKIKNTYLDKPLESLASQIEKIQKNNETITKASEAIQSTCEDIVVKYIHGIQDKIEKFEAKLNQQMKKFDIE